MQKIKGKTTYLYDIGNGLTLMNILTKNAEGKLDRVDTYIGVDELGFSCVGTAKDLSAPGVIFTYSSYVRQMDGLLGYYIDVFEKNTGRRVHKSGDKIWLEEIKKKQ